MADAPARRIAIVVDASLPAGLLGNAIAVVAVGVGASTTGLGGIALEDASGRTFRSSATVAVPVLQGDPDTLLMLLDRAIAAGDLEAVVAFPGFARTIHDFEAYRTALADIDLANDRLLALGLAGEAEAVKRMTRGLSLLR